VCIGLVVTDDGFPLSYEVFTGNTADSTTVQRMIEALERKHDTLNRIWVMDRGMVSESNLEYLRGREGGQYIVGTPKAQLRQYEKQLLDESWEQVREGIEVRLVPGPQADETYLLARSADRREKEHAMHEKFVERLEAGLRRLQASAAAGRLKDLGLAHERLGRLKTQNWRATQVFDVKIATLATPQDKAVLEVSWRRNEKFTQWRAAAEGCYLLRSNVKDLDAVTMWRRYIQLTEAEWAFRIAKDELSIRPIWHQKEERVQAHILVCFIAYAMWKTLAHWMKASGLGTAPRTMLDELAKIKSADVVLPVVARCGGAERTVRLRCVTAADKPQQALLSRMGIPLPKRLRPTDIIAPM
jgi:transposase